MIRRLAAGVLVMYACATAAAEAPVSLRLEWERLEMPADPPDQVLVSSDGRLQVTGSNAEFRFAASTDVRQGQVSLGRWAMQGGGGGTRVDVESVSGTLWGGTVTGRGTVDWSAAPSASVKVDVQSIDPGHRWPNLSGSVDGALTASFARRPDGVYVEAQLRSLAGRLQDQPIAGLAELSMTPSGMVLNGELTTEGLDLGPFENTALRASAQGSDSRQSVRLQIESSQGSTSVELVGGYAEGRWEGSLQQWSINDSLAGDFQLHAPAAVKIGADDVQLARTCLDGGTGQFCASAEWQAEQGWRGNIDVTGTFHVPEYGLELTGIALQTRGQGDAVELNGRVRSGPGQLVLQGSARRAPADDWHLDLELSGENFLVVNIPEAWVAASPALQLSGTTRDLTVTGSVRIPKAEFDLDLGGTSVTTTDDVVLASEMDDADASPVAMRSDVTVILGDAVRVHSEQFQGRLTGKLNVVDRPGRRTHATGEIRVVDASANAYGQAMNIDSGRLVYLDTPIDDPALDLKASRTVGDVNAGVHVTGYASAPQFDLYSSPPMNDEDVLSYLLVGRPVSGVSGQEGATLMAAASRLAFSNSSLITGSLGQRLGLDTVGLQGDAETGALVVGKYLSPRLYLNLGVGLFEPVRTLTLSYELTRDWTVEATTGTVSGADVLYEYERQ